MTHEKFMPMAKRSSGAGVKRVSTNTTWRACAARIYLIPSAQREGEF
jgi:hypothetical protein